MVGFVPLPTLRWLSLSIVQQIVEKLGGQVGVESVIGQQGSRFYFILP